MVRIFRHYVHRASLSSMLFDVALMILLALGAVTLQVGSLDLAVPLASGPVASYAACMMLIGSAAGLYDPASGAPLGRSVARVLAVLCVALPLAWLVFGLLPAGVASPGAVQFTVMSGVAALVTRRVYVSHRGAAAGRRARVLVFGTGAAAQAVGSTLRSADPSAHIIGYVPGPNESEPMVAADEIVALRGTLTETAGRLGVDEIVVALTERRAGSMPLRELLDCKLAGIRVWDLNSHFEKTLGQIRIDYLNASWLIFGDGFNQGALRTFVKRAFDLLSAGALLVLTAPLMLITALLIRLDSRGPVFYRQERVGLNGRTFEVTKFRSMRTDAECDGKPRWASANDDRVTRVGAVIRRLRIDELPQLFNVLRGEMSLVGPRPERPYFVDQLTQQIPFYAVRHSVKPGVTGWAQVRYAYGATVEDSQQKLQYDLYYVKNHTLFLDLLVLFETVGVVLTGKGAR
ncbi:MAG: TIGR03013 family XrtA/PEP-CTERM system glycosyltransferase [Pseudomonadota bacterium]|jgi:sugar transferase (PEP-CTERM system associated)|nr:TIGR03013 family PEP-CTERM/XrtA system glycosyltransferase [Rubrivivax sp.]MCA3259836.1 TIGR03013 family PEP-CTERM/XrtA system glycosyltransferase [Rubrivivax sp.]MCE2912509.1 TIGR03013 family PEP-CTERM/XrtA system glycosyltransferase [Rubrivivax sp.]MCZ8029638.1 TIGR03013 family PEP-CTERM/XrtA system glycosyltransferase [Rubrivivax sp.]